MSAQRSMKAIEDDLKKILETKEKLEAELADMPDKLAKAMAADEAAAEDAVLGRKPRAAGKAREVREREEDLQGELAAAERVRLRLERERTLLLKADDRAEREEAYAGLGRAEREAGEAQDRLEQARNRWAALTGRAFDLERQESEIDRQLVALNDAGALGRRAEDERRRREEVETMQRQIDDQTARTNALLANVR